MVFFDYYVFTRPRERMAHMQFAKSLPLIEGDPNMVNILYVLNGEFNYGGTEAVVLNYYFHISKKEIHIDFMIHAKSGCHDNPIHRKLMESGAEIFYVCPRNINIKKNRQDILEILKHHKYDIIHAHTDAVGSLILKLARKSGIKNRIAHSHNTAHQLQIKDLKSFLHYIYLEVCRIAIRFEATHYMACSERAAEWLFGKRLTHQLRKVYILHNAIDTKKYHFLPEKREKIRDEMGISNKYVIGHVGRFVPQKNHEGLIDIFTEFHKKRPNSILLLIGEGVLFEKIKNMVKKTGIEDSVIFAGAVSNVYDYMQGMDVFVLPSLFEGLPVTVIEAQAEGLPVLISDNVSKQTDITGQVKFIDNTCISDWLKELLMCEKTYVRKSVNEKIIDSGYDIYTEALRLEEYYLSISLS